MMWGCVTWGYFLRSFLLFMLMLTLSITIPAYRSRAGEKKKTRRGSCDFS